MERGIRGAEGRRAGRDFETRDRRRVKHLRPIGDNQVWVFELGTLSLECRFD